MAENEKGAKDWQIFEISNGNFILAIVAKWPIILPFFRDFCSKWRPLNFGRILDWLNKSSKKWPKWRSRVKLHNFYQFWSYIRNLRWKLLYEKIHVSTTLLKFPWFFWNFAYFGYFKWQFSPNGLKYCHFFVIFVDDDVLFMWYSCAELRNTYYAA